MACNKPFLRKITRPYVHYVPTPCGYCAACRRDKVSMWSDRLEFEANTWKVNGVSYPSGFVTLTYNDKHLPKDGVRLGDVQDWLKRFRYFLKRSFKYYVASEYGEDFNRPHYHVCLIGFDPCFRQDFDALYKSWANYKGEEIGFFTSDYLNSSRIRYTLKYMSKELVSNRKEEYEKLGLNRLFHTMSKGIGRDYFFEHLDDIRRLKGYYVNGILRPLPRYYADLLSVYDEDNRSFYDKYHRILDKLWVTDRLAWYPVQFPDFDESVMHDSVKERTMVHDELLHEASRLRHFGVLI